MGSKNRHSKQILPLILKDRKPEQWYVEPFVGGANMIDKVDGLRIGSDCNKYLIALLKEMQLDTFTAPDITEGIFDRMKNKPSQFKDWMLGYAGFQLSFGAMWFGSYRRDNTGKRNYSEEAMRNVNKQAQKVKGIDFYNLPYSDLEIPSDSIIYCDPPYKGTAKYKANEEEFKHDAFYDWVRAKAKEGHQVFISEYNMPDDFACIWQKEVNGNISKDTGKKKSIERLFVHETQIGCSA
jgi:DNA adenine methylase